MCYTKSILSFYVPAKPFKDEQIELDDNPDERGFVVNDTRHTVNKAVSLLAKQSKEHPDVCTTHYCSSPFSPISHMSGRRPSQAHPDSR